MKTLTVIALALSVTACGSIVGQSPSEYGYISVSADAEGMRAFGDSLNALVTNGKASPDKETDAWHTRKMQEQEVTKRRMKPDFLSGLFAPSSKPAIYGGEKK